MAETLSDVLDLAAAWKRVEADLNHRVFVRNPLELGLMALYPALHRFIKRGASQGP